MTDTWAPLNPSKDKLDYERDCFMCDICGYAYYSNPHVEVEMNENIIRQFCRPCVEVVKAHDRRNTLVEKRGVHDQKLGAWIHPPKKAPRRRRDAAAAAAKKAPKSKVSTDVDLARCAECATLILKEHPVLEHADGTFTCRKCMPQKEEEV